MPSHPPLHNRVALVTGGSRGIGRGCAEALAAAGADVAIQYHRDSTAAEAVAAAVRAAGRRAWVAQADVADRAAVEALVEGAEAELGPIDILVVSAVYSVREPFLETKWENLHRTVEVSLFGAFHVCQAVARRMAGRPARDGRRGSILVIGSPHAYTPFKHAVDYNIAKAGVQHMAMTMAAELTSIGIRVNVIEPGWTDTPGERKWTPDPELEAAGRRMPLGRLGTPADIGQAAVFLASDAADYIAGAVLRVDGGQVVSRVLGRH
ncbi:MAG TPA: SDR family oxidoreductase [Limnochordia bacterium]